MRNVTPLAVLLWVASTPPALAQDAWERAEASCYGTAFHYLPNETERNVRRFVGTYDFGLRKHRGRWRVHSLRYNVKFVDGNIDLDGTGHEV